MRHDADHNRRCARHTGLTHTGLTHTGLTHAGLTHTGLTHAGIFRRTAIPAGSIGLLGFGLNPVAGLRALAGDAASPGPQSHKAVIYIFLSGGLARHERFDPKPDAPENIRGEFAPIDTRTPDIRICEHLPMLAACSDK